MQNRRAFLFLILAIILGIGAAFTARQYLEDQARKPGLAEATTQPVVVVRSSVPVGTALTGREVITVDWPLAYVPEGAFSRPNQVEGRVLRRPLASGEPVLASALLEQGARGGLVSVIDPKARAISVKVDPVIGVAGFVEPGARVDVLVTVRESQGKPVTKLFLQDVRVLAIDQKLEEAKKGEPKLVQVVTLEVTPVQSERLTFASHEGRLQLALRNPTDREVVETRAANVSDVIGIRRNVKRRRVVQRASTNVEVVKGSNVTVEQF